MPYFHKSYINQGCEIELTLFNAMLSYRHDRKEKWLVLSLVQTKSLFFVLVSQVIARDGRPIVICEKGDEETQALAHKTLEVPHTVDCLQVSIKIVTIEFVLFVLPE